MSLHDSSWIFRQEKENIYNCHALSSRLAITRQQIFLNLCFYEPLKYSQIWINASVNGLSQDEGGGGGNPQEI